MTRKIGPSIVSVMCWSMCRPTDTCAYTEMPAFVHQITTPSPTSHDTVRSHGQ